MTWEIVVPLISGIIALGTFLYTLIGLRHKAETGYVDRLDKRLISFSDRLEKCEQDRLELREEMIELKTFRADHAECDRDREMLHAIIETLKTEIVTLTLRKRS